MTFNCRSAIRPISRLRLLDSSPFSFSASFRPSLTFLLRDRLIDEEANLVVVAVADLHAAADDALFGDLLRLGLAGGNLDLEAIEVAGRLGRLVGVDQLELVADRMLDQDEAFLIVAIDDGVRLRLADLGFACR